MWSDKIFKEKEIKMQVDKALAEKREIADSQLFTCSHCGSKEVDVDFISDDKDYLCECSNCGETWEYSKNEFWQETRKQNRVLAKAKRWWRWQGSNKIGRFKIVMGYILNCVLMLLFVGNILFVFAAAAMAGAL